jgi:hypothetical protein
MGKYLRLFQNFSFWNSYLEFIIWMEEPGLIAFDHFLNLEFLLKVWPG